LTFFTNKTDKMQPPMPVPSPTLGQYLFDCLKVEGITEIFGIPGDYNFSLLDTLEQYEGIRFINGRNELGAGYSSDGYGRLRTTPRLVGVNYNFRRWRDERLQYYCGSE
jgi:indolepyruvate decarboxylase